MNGAAARCDAVALVAAALDGGDVAAGLDVLEGELGDLVAALVEIAARALVRCAAFAPGVTSLEDEVADLAAVAAGALVAQDEEEY